MAATTESDLSATVEELKELREAVAHFKSKSARASKDLLRAQKHLGKARKEAQQIPCSPYRARCGGGDDRESGLLA